MKLKVIRKNKPYYIVSIMLDRIRATKSLAHRKKLKEIDEYSKDILHRNWF